VNTQLPLVNTTNAGATDFNALAENTDDCLHLTCALILFEQRAARATPPTSSALLYCHIC
jgi:hypothetical protein